LSLDWNTDDAPSDFDYGGCPLSSQSLLFPHATLFGNSSRSISFMAGRDEGRLGPCGCNHCAGVVSGLATTRPCQGGCQSHHRRKEKVGFKMKHQFAESRFKVFAFFGTRILCLVTESFHALLDTSPQLEIWYHSSNRSGRSAGVPRHFDDPPRGAKVLRNRVFEKKQTGPARPIDPFPTE
jgi:hypothetical protein